MQYCIRRHQWSNYINVSSDRVLDLLRIREHICSLKNAAKNNSSQHLMHLPHDFFFLKIIPWVCVGERNSFKLTKMDTFLHGLQWYRFGSTVLRPWASCIPLRPATILKAPWWCHRMMWVWSFFDCGVHVTYINLPALYMEQSWAMCTFTKLWSIM